MDVAVIGGGIAGISVAAELASAGVRVVLLEQEDQLAYHSSGRSAAAFLESYGSPEIRALTRASRPVLAGTGDAAAETSLLSPRPLIWLAAPSEAEELSALLEAEPLLRPATDAEVRRLCPVIRPGWAAGAAIEPGAQDLDVAGLFQHYRRRALAAGAVLQTRAALMSGKPDGKGWVLHTAAGEIRADAVVNAAGAWADQVAVRCGVEPVGLRPLRRTVAIVSAEVSRDWPLVCDLGERFYFRPEGDALLLSPADETPTEPGDARPEPEDIALAIERANEATTLGLRHVRTSWAGLRTFAPDRNPVVGEDPACPGFFWLAGQGGYGMQTAPAMARLAAATVLGAPTPPDIAAEGLDPQRLAPARLRP
ncbi:MAG TPA: FAD-dependent oxidoreductase [Micromonosporaceae bacterium]|nr:FAD-dependent oxidoreductase [Micromonosporaceae bacterium]